MVSGAGGGSKAHLLSNLSKQPQLVFAQSISHAPEFYYSGEPAVTFWDDGSELLAELRSQGLRTDISFFDDTERSFILEGQMTRVNARPCLVTARFFEEKGLSFGDVIRLSYGYAAANRYNNLDQGDYIVIGTFMQTDARSNIYTTCYPPDAWEGLPSDIRVTSLYSYDPIAGTTTYEQVERKDEFWFNAGSFSLRSPEELDDVKEALAEMGFGSPGRQGPLRTFVMIRDKVFNRTINDLNRQLTYISTLFPIMFIAVLAIAVFVSYLLLSARKSDFAIMKGLGCGTLRSFMSFFAEQLMLCLFGAELALGVFALWLGAGSLTGELLANCGIFALLYLLGGAGAVIMMARTSALKLFAEKE